ncbi:hypothetical protein HanIR_Chr16g0843561 [Helianthus annuus]|nr:hypothetical protein HanIR_Chr16g0843561 [Helianthus annuus]
MFFCLFKTHVDFLLAYHAFILFYFFSFVYYSVYQYHSEPNRFQPNSRHIA